MDISREIIQRIIEKSDRQRHECLNHIQVLWGYLQIGEEEKALEYLKKATEHKKRQSGVKKIENEILSFLYFLNFNFFESKSINFYSEKSCLYIEKEFSKIFALIKEMEDSFGEYSIEKEFFLEFRFLDNFLSLLVTGEDAEQMREKIFKILEKQKIRYEIEDREIRIYFN